jgi:hypothetical protein
MCMNCGCGEIDERHGDNANIVADDVRRAAAAAGQDLATTARNLETSLRQLAEPGMATSGAGRQAGSGSSTTGRMSSGQ